MTRETRTPGRPRLAGRQWLLARARDAVTRGPVLVSGPPGIGKSALLDAVLAEAAERGTAVVRVAPQEGDQQPFVTVIDLLAELDPDSVAGTLAATSPTMLRWSVLAALRALAARAPVLLAVDNAQWLDRASGDAVFFALRRIRSERVGVILAERSTVDGESTVAALAGDPDRLVELVVPPLDVEGLRELLEQRLDHPLPYRTLSRLHAESGGLPRLAVELARPLPAEPNRLDRALQYWLRPLSEAARGTLLLAALADQPTVALLERSGRDEAEQHLRAAAELGMLDLTPDGALRFTNRALPDFLATRSATADLRAAHGLLARAVSDPVLRTRHRALATVTRSDAMAVELDEAAEVARRRAQLELAARLGELAAEHTPAAQRSDHLRRLVAASEDAAAAGEVDLTDRLAQVVLAHTDQPEPRVRARLAAIEVRGQALAELDEAFACALADARDSPGLLAQVYLRLACRANLGGDPHRARDYAIESAATAQSAADAPTQVAAMTMVGRMGRLLGDPAAEHTLGQALALADEHSIHGQGAPLHDGPHFVAARHAFFDNRLDDAREALLGLLADAGHDGAVEVVVTVLRTLAEVEARSGQCASALHHAGRALRITERRGLSPGPAWYTAAIAEFAGGRFDRAAELAAKGARASEQEHDRIYLARSQHLLGAARLAVGDVEGALPALCEVREIESAQGVVDPSTLLWQADLAEALALAGQHSHAKTLVAQVRLVAQRLDRSGVLAMLLRAEAVRLAAEDEFGAAARLLRQAVEQFAELGLPLERGRTLLVLGGTERRRRRTAAARCALREAEAEFSRCAAEPWLELARTELARLDASVVHALDPAALTAGENRIAELAAEGASNRQIAARLFMSVKTVEATLTRVYRKLGVRSRAGLAARILAGA